MPPIPVTAPAPAPAPKPAQPAAPDRPFEPAPEPDQAARTATAPPAPAPAPAEQPAVQPPAPEEAAAPVTPPPAEPAVLEPAAPVANDAAENSQTAVAVPNTVAPGTMVLEGGYLQGAPPEKMRATRRPGGDEKVTLSFKETKLEDTLPFIVETTGKAVMIRLQQVRATVITLVMDRPVSRQDALDLLFQAFRLAGVGVVETDKVVMIDQLMDANKLQPVTVLGPEVNVFDQPEDGNICIKIFKIKNTKAQNVYDRLQDNVPDYAQVSLDANSNQIILDGDIGLAKRFQRLIDLLDVPAYLDVQTETFKLDYADAQQISTIIQDLFAARTVGGGGGAAAGQAPGQPRGGQQPGQPGGQARRAGGSGGEGLIKGTSEQLVVTVLPATNSLTVRAEPEVMAEIRKLIATAWDVPITKNGDPFRLYDLKYTDPLKVKDLLQSLLEGGSSRGTSRPFAAGGAATGNRQTGGRAAGGAGGGGDSSGADVAVSNVFRIEAYPDSNRLLVVSKTPDNFKWLDSLVEAIDQPLNSGLPLQVELKHASAVKVAEILNALLAEAGTGSGIAAPEEGLSGIDFQTAGGGTTGAQSTTSSSSLAGGPNGATTPGAGGEIRFPWQNARGAGSGEQTEVSSLVGKTRVVPNAGQNSLLVLAPPEIQQSMVKVIEQLDRPGRQVMIAAVLAEVALGDEFAFGLRFGQAGQVLPTNPNNAIVINGNLANNQMYSGSRENVDFIGDLTTSILSFGVPATVVLQALEEKTNVRILQQPRVFTSDNKEAKFFDGADVPFQTGQTTGGTTGGGTTASFSQIAVGIGLNVRPRITRDRNVAMEVEVLYSNVGRASTANTPGNNPTIERRQTNTSVVVKNGQTIVLGGIRTENEAKNKTKVPLLGDVPVLDWVFSSQERVTTTNELVLFITPIVVDNPDENDSNFNVGELERLRALERPLDDKVQKMQEEAGFERRATTAPPPSNPQTQPVAPIETPAPQPSPAAPDAPKS
ncbi:MAG: secretin N-terminal domain-containing protein [Phycisphaerales bacterium]